MSRNLYYRSSLSALALLLAPAVSLAQGTATSPSTAHIIDPNTNIVWIGGPNDTINGPGAIPIDLDVNGGPWRKAISASPTGNGFGGGSLLLSETILNAGAEPWTDWHEIDAHIGSHGTVWSDILDVRINGTSISFNSTVSGATVDLDNFSQPVLPGDVLQIDKRLEALTDNFVSPGTLVASVLEFPTSTVPEPASVLLTALSCVALGAVRRQRSTPSNLPILHPLLEKANESFQAYNDRAPGDSHLSPSIRSDPSRVRNPSPP